MWLVSVACVPSVDSVDSVDSVESEDDSEDEPDVGQPVRLRIAEDPTYQVSHRGWPATRRAAGPP